MRKFLILMVALALAGCNYSTQLSVTTDTDTVELAENPDSVETRNDVRLNLQPIKNGEPAKFSKGRMTIEYKQGASTVARVEIDDKLKSSSIDAKASLMNDGTGGITGFVPFPLMADSAFVTIAGKIDGKWLERVIIVIKAPDPPPPVELKVSITAEGAENGILVVPEGSLVVLKALPEGGRPPYTFAWSNPKGEVVGQSEALTLRNFSCHEAGVYNVKVVDADGESAQS